MKDTLALDGLAFGVLMSNPVPRAILSCDTEVFSRIIYKPDISLFSTFACMFRIL